MVSTERDPRYDVLNTVMIMSQQVCFPHSEPELVTKSNVYVLTHFLQHSNKRKIHQKCVESCTDNVYLLVCIIHI